jgi:hypothetical protein
MNSNNPNHRPSSQLGEPDENDTNNPQSTPASSNSLNPESHLSSSNPPQNNNNAPREIEMQLKTAAPMPGPFPPRISNPQPLNLNPSNQPPPPFPNSNQSNFYPPPVYSQPSPPSYEPPAAAPSRPRPQHISNISCFQCNTPYLLPQGSISWRCRNCGHFNNIQGDQCCIS